MSAQSTTRRPVQLSTRSIVPLLIVLAIVVVVVAALEWPAATPTTPTGVPRTAPDAEPMPSSTQEAVVVGGGVYLVGSDIPGGTYRGRVNRAPAYWQISLDAQGSLVVGRSGRLAGEFDVQVVKGQYLHVAGAQLIRLD